ncbi:MAG: recombination protein RecR [Succinivibrio sp.]|nr:recombination protein RecR [Succinivibrio sp.]
MSSSVLLERLINALQVMPGVGPVSAARIAYHLLDRRRQDGLNMARIITEALNGIALCPRCRNYTDQEGELCGVCAQELRRHSALLCVVEAPSDVQAVEDTAAYQGTYFVLHGHLSPIDGIGTAELGLPLLEEILRSGEIKEVILALSQTVEGNTTAAYIAKLCQSLNLQVSRIASGVPVGGELGNVDQSTLATSFNYRRPY